MRSFVIGTSLAAVAWLVLYCTRPTEHVTIVHKEAPAHFQHVPMLCNDLRPVCVDWLGRTLEIDI